MVVSRPGTERRAWFQRAFGSGGGPGEELDIHWNFCLSPRTDAMVFSCAPPTIKRVMTCVTRIHAQRFTFRLCRRLMIIRFSSSNSGLSALRGILEIEVVILPGRFEIIPFESDFSQAVVGHINGITADEAAHGVVIVFRFGQVAEIEISDGAVAQGIGVVRLLLSALG